MSFIRLLLLAILSEIMILCSCKKDTYAEQPTQEGLVSFYNFQGKCI